MSAERTPIFVDDTGRRRALTRRAGRVVVAGFSAYLGLVVLGFARDPRVGPISLPSFGLPTLGLITPPALPLLQTQESQPVTRGEASRGEQTARAGSPSTSTTGVPGLPLSSTSTTVGRLTTTTTGPKGSTTTTSSTAPPAEPGTTTTTSTDPTTTTTAPTTTTSHPGQGQGHDATATSGKGPDGGGPPGQLRKATTPTTVG